MVSSRINPSVVFKEHKTIDPEDKGHQSSLYELDIGRDKNILIALGKPKYTFSPQNVVYYPIYMVSLNNAIEGCIGVFETKLNDPKMGAINLDEDGDIDINKMGSPILFDFSDKLIDTTKTTVEAYLENAAGVISSKISEQVLESSQIEGLENTVLHESKKPTEEEEEEPEEDILKLPPASKKSIRPEKKDNVFTINSKTSPPLPLLPEETEQEAEEIKSKFATTNQSNWIQNFFKNPHYQIHSIPGDGDCFFTTVVRAFAQIGRITTVEKLRKLVAEEADAEIFEQYQTVYVTLKEEIRNFEREMKDIKSTVEVDLKKRAERVTDPKQKEALVNEAKMLNKKHRSLTSQRNEMKGLIHSTTGDLAEITTLDKFRAYIQTSTFWANEWAISIIEKKLNVKMIILSEVYYNENDLNNVLNCGEINKDIQTRGVFNPEYYIITTYSGNHYELVSYRDKKILKYSEIPYHIKILVIKRCLERNSGIYYLIQEFRDLKLKLEIDPDEGNPKDNEREEEEMALSGREGLYDPKIVFVFYSRSNKKLYPGKGSQEEIPKEKMGEFSTLATIDDWRKKLDDNWSGAKFSLDGFDYASVEHYYQGAKFKNSHPDFAELFSLNSNSPISKDVDLCRGAGGKSGKYKGEQIRRKDYKIDPDFYPERNKEERRRAVEAKFTQNVDLQFMLLNTKNAKLVQYVPGSNRRPDVDLMEIRDKFARDVRGT
jgi:predicted NAD-dependent protein-ADP-ribosyltransferase YbiA (DUF1768 family)